ncbi:hypothetical protein PFISCL1PPCAC_4948, partial [Pristionchus fissidentatus]
QFLSSRFAVLLLLQVKLPFLHRQRYRSSAEMSSMQFEWLIVPLLVSLSLSVSASEQLPPRMPAL